MTRKRSGWATLLVVSTLSALPLLAVAQMGGGYGPGYGMGPGMMGGYGPGYGMMGGYGGYGMGPGMMGGGYGSGYGMGPGMMGGGYGPGARQGGYGPGYGPGPLYSLNLSDRQRDKIEKIRDAERKRHWEIGGKVLEEQNRLRDLYQSDHQDPKKIGAVYGDIAKLQQQMLEAHVRADNQVQQVLTKEQREQLRQWQRGGYGPGDGTGPGMRNRGYGPGVGPGMMRR